MKKWASLFLNNLGTKLMALTLALLLWMYLYNESTETDEFDAVFEPKIEESSLYSRHFFTSDGQPLERTIHVKVTGPKGELRGLSKRGLVCSPRFERERFESLVGSFTRDLTVEDLNLPEGCRVIFKPSPQILTKYVKYSTRKVKLRLPSDPYEGTSAKDFTALPPKILHPADPDSEIEVRMPADRTVTEITLKKIPLRSTSQSFVTQGRLDRTDDSITLLGEVTIEVKVERETISEQLSLPVYLSGDTSITSRLELKTKDVAIKVVGTKTDLAYLQANKSKLYAFAIADNLTDRDLVPDNLLTLNQIQCWVREESLQNKVTVTVITEEVSVRVAK